MICAKHVLLIVVSLHITRAVPSVLEGSNEVITDEERERVAVLQSITKEILQYMDDSIDPCDDFFGYACKNFETHHPVPSDRFIFNVDALLAKRVKEATKEFIETTPSGDPNDAATKVRELYRMCLDIERRNELGIQPLLHIFDSLGGWHAINESVSGDDYDWLDILGRLGQFGITPVISFGLVTDFAEPDRYVLAMREDNALSPIPRSQALSYPVITRFYRDYIVSMLKATSISPDVALEVAQDIVDFSIELVKLTVDTETVKDEKENYARVTISELQSNITEIDWIKLLETSFERKIDPDQIVVIMSTPYYAKLPELLRKTPPKTIVNYFFWQVIKKASEFLHDTYKDINLQILNALYGIETSESVEESCLNMAQEAIDRPIQAFFIQNYFDKESKTAAIEMANSFQSSFRRGVASTDWLDEETKESIVEKLDNMQFLIGYPEELSSHEYVNKKYRNIEIVEGEYFKTALNVLRATVVEMHELLNTHAKKDEWLMSPMVVNAFYSRTLNQIVLPAGHLQPPYYHRYYPRAINFGAMGMVIGHEMTHGFDKGGRDHDSQGKMEESWTSNSASLFDGMTECFVEQYSNYHKYNISLRGRSTVDENISDSGGIRLAYHAYLEWLEENQPKDNLVLPGLEATDKQLFFLAYAHSWCTAQTESAAIKAMRDGSHSLAEFRIRGSLSNMAEFAEAYNCPNGSPMNPEKKCVVW